MVNVLLWLASPLNEHALDKEKDKKLSEQFKELGQFAKNKYILAFIAMALELSASYLIPKEHIHLKPFISKVHEECDN